MKVRLLAWLVFLCAAAAATLAVEGAPVEDDDNDNDNDSNDDDDDDGDDNDDDDNLLPVQPRDIVDWLETEHKGFFMSDKIDLSADEFNLNDDNDNGYNDAKYEDEPYLLAKEDIRAGDVLLIIPESAILEPDGGEEERLQACATAWKLMHEYSQNEASTFYPYPMYLLTTVPQPPPLASSFWWSEEGAAVVRQITGKELEPQDFGHADNSRLVPKCQDEQAYGRYLNKPDFQKTLQKALSIVQHRHWNKYMVPLYDMVKKGDAPNVIHSDITFQYDKDLDSLGYQLTALTDIAKGDALVLAHQSTAERFLQYGTVGPYPHTWWIQTLYDNQNDPDEGFEEFLIFHVTPNNNTKTAAAVMPPQYQVSWFANPASPPYWGQLRCLEANLRRLQKIDVDSLLTVVTNETESIAIVDFYNAWVTGLTHALVWGKYHHEQEQDNEEEQQEPTCAAAGDDDDDDKAQEEECRVATATTTKPRHRRRGVYYDALDDQVDPLKYNDAHVGIGCYLPLYDSDVYESHTSPYQEVEWAQMTRGRDPNKNNTPFTDTCLVLDSMVHSCVSTRPLVHETIVHYPASFFAKERGLKRVLFVGGGDLIILHEIMKYNDTLELVIGMELDQDVLRSSFRHYGVLPQFDDPRVEWWFGDASKSLALLPPEEYFGTFDLIMIDLIPFVFENLKVRNVGLVEYLMRLLQPNGILIRQEDYAERYKTSTVAKYMVELNLVGIPYLCLQAFTMFSNGIDFSKTPRVDHELTDNCFYEPLLDDDDGNDSGHLSLWGEFQTNHEINNKPASKVASCDSQQQQQQEEEDDDSSKMGLLVIIEAENVTAASLADSLVVSTNLRKALEMTGFTNVNKASTTTDNDKNHSSYFIHSFVFEEGYMMARTWSEHDYCALDLQMWNSIEKRQEAIAQLLKAVGGSGAGSNSTISSFQITTGGMHGTTTRTTASAAAAAAAATSDCEPAGDDTGKRPLAQPLEKNEYETILQELVARLAPPPATSASSGPLLFVVCGGGECQSLEALKKKNQENVILVESCVGGGGNDGDEAQLLWTCERQLKATLRQAVLDAGAGSGTGDGTGRRRRKVDGFVLDATAPKAMGQVIHKAFNNSLVRHELLSDDFLILVQDDDTTTSDDDDGLWRKNFLERFRTEIVQFNPVVHALVRFSSSSSSTTTTDGGSTTNAGLGMRIFSAGDEDFYGHIMDVMAKIDETTSLTSSLERAKPGLLAHIPNYQPVKIATRDEYDFEPSRKQWHGQRPVAYQTVIQFQSRPVQPIPLGAKVMYCEYQHNRNGYWYPGKVEKVHEDKQHYDVSVKGKPKRFVPPSKLLHVTDYVGTEKLDFGDHVMAMWEDDGKWYYACVVGEEQEDGLYKVQRYMDGALHMKKRNDLTRTRDKPGPPQVLDGMTCSEFVKVWEKAIDKWIQFGVKKESKAKATMTEHSIGDGCVAVGVLSGGDGRDGSIVSSWDGRGQVDVNLFTTTKIAKSSLELLQQSLPKEIPNLVRVQYDTFPRGMGRVVNFAEEVAGRAAWFDAENVRAFKRRRKV